MLDLIEEMRTRMNKLAYDEGLSAQEVLRLSQELDELLNEYEKWKKSKKASASEIGA